MNGARRHAGLFQTASHHVRVGFGTLAATWRKNDRMAVSRALSVFPWARYRRHDPAVKLQTQMDLRGSIPMIVQITERKRADVTFLDDLLLQPGCDLPSCTGGYVDFARLPPFTAEVAFVVTRTKRGIR